MESSFRIRVLDGREIDTLWPAFEAALRRAFGSAEFVSDDTTIETPVTQVRRAIKKCESDKHLVALDAQDNILGTIFNIPSERHERQESTEIGWFFVCPELTGIRRRRVADGLMTQAIEMVIGLGFDEIETEIGTRAGESAASRRYGFVYSPTSLTANRWVKRLKPSPE